MGQKDIGEKILESYNDVFADIVNVLLFNGKQVLEENELEEVAPRSAYKADGRYREIERDTAKRWKMEDIHLACIGIENQMYTDQDMPLRILAYDAAEYRKQLTRNRRNQQHKTVSRYPVVTLVLYFDYHKRWDEPLSLLECLNIPEQFRSYVNDYKVNLFDISFLEDEQVKLFRSDFRFVADYFVQKCKTGDYKPGKDEIRHVQETLSLMSILTQDHRFEEIYTEDSETEGREIRTMCDVLDRIEEKGIVKGREEGRAEGKAAGREECRREMAAALSEKGVALNIIAEAAGVTIDEVRKWLE